MTIYRATAVLNHRTGINRDAARNVWHFSEPAAASSTIAAAIASAVSGFYMNIGANYFSPCLSQSTDAHRIDVASVDPGSAGAADDTVSSLIGSHSFTLAPSTANDPLPNEVAAVLSFTGDVAGVPEESGLTRPRSRRRGRVYLGPLNESLCQGRNTTDYEPEITDNFKEAVMDAYDLMALTLVTASANLRHVIYSPTDAMGRVVLNVSINNEFDTVRRRGIKAQNKFTRSIDWSAPATGRSGTEVALPA